MKKEMYKKIMHTAESAEALDGILSVAVNDIEIGCDDFGELLNEKYEIIMKERR